MKKMLIIVAMLLLTSCNYTAINENVIKNNKKDDELEQEAHNVEIIEKDNEKVNKVIEKAEEETLNKVEKLLKRWKKKHQILILGIK